MFEKEAGEVDTSKFIQHDEVVTCDTYGCILHKHLAQRVGVSRNAIYRSVFYCRSHKKPYDSVVYNIYDTGIEYYGTVRMNEDGTPYHGEKSKK